MCLYTTSLFNTNYVLKTHLAFTQTSLKFLIQTRSQTHVYIKYVLHVFTPNSFSTNELSHHKAAPAPQRNAQKIVQGSWSNPKMMWIGKLMIHHWIVWEYFQTKPTRTQIELTWNLGPSGFSHGERPRSQGPGVECTGFAAEQHRKLRFIPQNRVAHSTGESPEFRERRYSMISRDPWRWMGNFMVIS